MTTVQLRKFCKEMQSRLGLSEWKISIRFSKECDMAGGEYAGHAFWKPEYREGEILVLRVQDEYEIKHTVCHELIHILLENHRDRPKRYDPMYERGLNALAEAILGKPEA